MSTDMESVFRIGKQASVLPAGYTQLEYIESTGWQYIDTGFKFTTTSKIELEALIVGGTGFMGSINTNINRVRLGISSGKIYNQLGIDTNLFIEQDNQYHKYITTATEVYIDNIQRTVEGFENQTMNYCIFGQNDARTSAISAYLVAKLKYLKIWDNNTLVRNFIPAKRNSDNVIGMYDLVSNTFFTNAGTGNFTAGPAVEVCKISQNNQTIWERAISLESDKDSEVTFRSTRNESKNLYNYDTMLTKFRIEASDLTIYSTQPGNYTPIIPVKPNTTYYLSFDDSNYSGSPGVGRVILFNSTTTPTEGSVGTRAIMLDSLTVGGSFTTDSDTTYIAAWISRSCGSDLYPEHLAQMNNSTMLVEGSTTPTSYEPYWNTLPELNAYGNTAQPSAIKPYVKTAISTTPTSFNSELAGPLNVLADGKTEQRNIPAEYQELESITFPSGAYIKTGIIPNTYDYEVGFKGAFGKTASGPNCAWGYMGVSTFPRWLCGTWNDKYLMNANVTTSFGVADTNNHTFVCRVYEKNSACYWSSEIDGVIQQDDQKISSTPSWEANTLEIYVGARNNEGVDGNYGLITANHWWCKKAGVMIADYTPAKRLSDNAIGMYDTVSQTFFTNAGTGTFTAGPVKTPGPNNPMDIVSNNGIIKWDGTKIVTEGIQEKITITGPNGEEQIILVPMLNRVGDYKDYIIYDD